MDKLVLILALLICVSAAQAGRSITVSPNFPYYKDRSPESIAQEIHANGYDDVRLICINKSQISDDLLKAFRAVGIKVWYASFCNGVYPPAELPKGWESWQMKMKHPARPDGFISFCPNNPDYRAWKKATVVAALRQHEFYGIDLMEPFLPAYFGPESDHYGCLCEYCVAAFKRMYPEAGDPPDFEDPNSPRYWKTDKALYAKWVEFRVASVVRYLDDLVNGKGGVREMCPKVKVATWSLGLDVPDQLAKLREWEAVDGAAIVKRVKPDLHVIQTDWPDWMKPNLPSSYPLRYKPVLDSVRAVAPSMPIMLQADIGSRANMRRSRAWISEVEKSARRAGFESVTSYEYFIGDYIYTEPPRVVKAVLEPGGIKLIFSKRLDATSASYVANYTLSPGKVDSARVDGSIVHLAVSGIKGKPEICVSGISDDASRRLYHDKPACVMVGTTKIRAR